MKFRICTDSASNLTDELIDKYGIEMISYKAHYDEGREFICYVRGRDYDASSKEYYDNMRKGVIYKTSLINAQDLAAFFEQFLSKGEDVLFVCMSSGLTGTCGSARIAAEELMEKYPDRKCIAVDSMAASLGEGLMVMELARLRDEENYTIEQAAKWLEDNRLKMCHIFTVDDLKYLKRGGRISGAAAAIASVLNIKPILKASDAGTIVSVDKIRGRKKTLNAVIDMVKEQIVNPQEQVIALAHGDCEEEAKYVAERLKEECKVKDVIIKIYDTCTGSHVGPGTIAVFFMGEHR